MPARPPRRRTSRYRTRAAALLTGTWASAGVERWLTREEAARLIWTCWRARETQTVHHGLLKGQKIETEKRPLRHIAWFLLIGMYTGTRAGAIASASPERDEGWSFVDLERGIFYRLAEGKRATNKRQPPVRSAAAALRRRCASRWPTMCWSLS